jgi:hypothetical protein
MENSCCRAVMMHCRSCTEDAVSIISSTQRRKYTMSDSRQSTNRLVSALDSTNLSVSNNVAKRMYQALGACFRPYRDLLRRQTKLG